MLASRHIGKYDIDKKIAVEFSASYPPYQPGPGFGRAFYRLYCPSVQQRYSAFLCDHSHALMIELIIALFPHS
ncbi:hypothetical protein CAP48_08115 [Advenella sp. S44]|nr:hypothetical protein CAP48_08115 [Advenella sp. S44]